MADEPADPPLKRAASRRDHAAARGEDLSVDHERVLAAIRCSRCQVAWPSIRCRRRRRSSPGLLHPSLDWRSDVRLDCTNRAPGSLRAPRRPWSSCPHAVRRLDHGGPGGPFVRARAEAPRRPRRPRARAPLTERAMQSAKRELGYAVLIASLREGPPMPLRLVDAQMNTAEYFIHHEDVRRATPEWEPRQDAALDASLWSLIRRSAWLFTRRIRRAPACSWKRPVSGLSRRGGDSRSPPCGVARRNCFSTCSVGGAPSRRIWKGLGIPYLLQRQPDRHLDQAVLRRARPHRRDGLPLLRVRVRRPRERQRPQQHGDLTTLSSIGPSVRTGLAGTAVNADWVALRWTASTGNISVTG